MSLLLDALKHAQQSNADNPPASQIVNESVDSSSAKQNMAGTQAAQAIFSATTKPQRGRLTSLILILLIVLISLAGAWFYLETPADDAINVHTPPPAHAPKQNVVSASTAIDANDASNPATTKTTNVASSPLIVNKNKNNTKQENTSPRVYTKPDHLLKKTGDDTFTTSTTPIKPAPKPKTNQKTNTANAPIGLTASTNPDPLKEAYAALTEGKLDEAERKYLAVLVKRPHEKDALLGLAIIAHRKSQTARALELYQQVLREDPENANATAGLLSLSAAADPVAAEGHLKQALDLKQASPELHYALGNLLARQKRWSEAQQAFFRAANLAPDHALYTYNLAVALDHLGKSGAAISSYEKALQLSKPQDSAINRNAIRQRVQELRKYLLNNPGNNSGNSTGSP